jgi:hypothetical protein
MLHCKLQSQRCVLAWWSIPPLEEGHIVAPLFLCCASTSAGVPSSPAMLGQQRSNFTWRAKRPIRAWRYLRFYTSRLYENKFTPCVGLSMAAPSFFQ